MQTYRTAEVVKVYFKMDLTTTKGDIWKIMICKDLFLNDHVHVCSHIQYRVSDVILH